MRQFFRILACLAVGIATGAVVSQDWRFALPLGMIAVGALLMWKRSA